MRSRGARWPISPTSSATCCSRWSTTPRWPREAGHFDFEAVAERIAAKMIRRHPHVFGDAVVADAAEQTRAWEATKAAERATRRARAGESAGRRAARAAGAHPGRQAAEAGRARRLRLAGRRAGPGQDRRGDRRAARRARDRTCAGPGERRARRPAVRGGQSRPPSRGRSGGTRCGRPIASSSAAFGRSSRPSPPPGDAPRRLRSTSWKPSGSRPRGASDVRK